MSSRHERAVAAPVQRRRLLGAAAASLVASTVVRGQARRLPRVAFVSSSASPSAQRPDPAAADVRAFVRGLRDLGLVDGRDVVVERRSTAGRIDGLAALMDELVRSGVDVIVTVGGPATWAAHRATRRIPIVALVDEVLDTGLVDSLARPGHNVTGIGESDVAIHGKRLQLLKLAVPTTSRVAVITYTQGPNDRGEWRRQLDAAAAAQKLAIVWLAVDAPEQFDAAFAAIVRAGADAIYATATYVNDVHARRIADFALERRLPSIGFAKDGMLLSYESDETETLARAAAFVKKILDGAPPGELPFEQPTKFDLTVNLKTAKALGIAVPRAMRSSAQSLIE
jgi:putative ABC transport system substrate-binding protein